jgi:hypothetical protein
MKAWGLVAGRENMLWSWCTMRGAYIMKTGRTAFSVLVGLLLSTAAVAGPGYEQDRKQLESVMQDMIAWFPGVWDSYPQVYYENTIAMPKGGEHEHWHRTFARINAPQIGEVVFYGQINAEGRDGPIIAGSQVLYKAMIDEKLGAVNIFGQGPLEPEKYENLHERPELWSQVQMREPGALNCNFIWRRDGGQLFGVLQGNTVEKQKYGPGTCAFISKRTDEEFRADAEWVLTPDQLWLYDNNWMADMLFLGREDQTHIKLYRASPYECRIQDKDGARTLKAHDRGFRGKAMTANGQARDVLLLRAEFPAAVGVKDELRLMVTEPGQKKALASTEGKALADSISLRSDGVDIKCRTAKEFSRLQQTP